MRPLRPHGAKTARGTDIPIRTMTSLPKIFKGLRGWLGRVHETNRVQVCNTSHHEIFENQKSFLELHGTELRQIWDILGHLYNTERLRMPLIVTL